jgi:hypothetical protein
MFESQYGRGVAIGNAAQNTNRVRTTETESGAEQCNAPQRVREIDAFAALLRTQRAKVREANARLGEMRGRLFGDDFPCEGGRDDDAKVSHSSLGEVRSLFEQLDAETDELLGHIGRLEDLA